MVLGLTFLTEPNLSLATTQQVDDLKKKNHPKKKKLTLDPQRGQGSNLTSLTLIFLATNKLDFYINKLNSKKICFIFLTFFFKRCNINHMKPAWCEWRRNTHSLFCSFVLPGYPQKPPVAPHFKRIDAFAVIFGRCPRFTSIGGNTEDSSP